MSDPNNSPITLTASQQEAFDKMTAFAKSDKPGAFILRGYAGTGKTTLVRTLLRALEEADIDFFLLASTGRAAKVLANATGRETSTVHSLIYLFQELNQDLEKVAEARAQKKSDDFGQLQLNFALELLPEESQGQLYIVDEASMISDAVDGAASQARFGTGRLLSDFLSFDPRGRFIFIGDECQLPPVSQPFSPALSPSYLQEQFNMNVQHAQLKEIVRQAKGNDIVVSAEKVRRLYANPPNVKWAKFPLGGYGNIHLVDTEVALVNMYLSDVKANGLSKSTLLCQTNKQCDQLTQILRPALGKTPGSICVGDLLLVTQNCTCGLMNGDLVTVQEVGAKECRAGLTFVNMRVREVFTEKEFEVKLISDVVFANGTNILPSQHKDLFIDFYYRMKDDGIKQKSQAFRDAMLTDPYLNGLRAVFGYALTCHKAQGGEWEHVYLDIPSSLSAREKPFVYQWVYTAMTRARKELYTVRGFWIEGGAPAASQGGGFYSRRLR